MKTADIEYLGAVCREAGAAILEVYDGEIDVTKKADDSPVTEADLRAHRLIVGRLRERWPETPVLSEESAAEVSWEERREWRRFWLVDPLDGTKEFIKRNGQFTVNIALIEDGRPVAGWVYAPVPRTLYWAEGEEAFRVEADGAPVRLTPSEFAPDGVLRVVGSLSHSSPEMDEFLAEQRRKYRDVQFIAMGSSLKICLVADGAADVYPRFGPTMEWDTAAAHAVVNAAGRRVSQWGSESYLVYNKRDLRNPWFVVT